jgi:ribosomal-protein-alanine N-acetyltransferase
VASFKRTYQELAGIWLCLLWIDVHNLLANNPNTKNQRGKYNLREVLEMILETERLVLRNWLASDVNCYMVLAKDVGYNCFSRPGHFLVHTTEEAKERVQHRIILFNERKLGKFPIFLKGTGEFIGTCGLESFELAGQTEVELGYRLCLKYWGRGYAAESATAVLRYGFGELSLKRIKALALPQNRASLKILEKLGFQYLHDFAYAELPHRLYEIADRFIA